MGRPATGERSHGTRHRPELPLRLRPWLLDLRQREPARPQYHLARLPRGQCQPCAVAEDAPGHAPALRTDSCGANHGQLRQLPVHSSVDAVLSTFRAQGYAAFRVQRHHHQGYKDALPPFPRHRSIGQIPPSPLHLREHRCRRGARRVQTRSYRRCKGQPCERA